MNQTNQIFRSDPIPFRWVVIAAIIVLGILYYTAAYSDVYLFSQQQAVMDCVQKHRKPVIVDGGIMCVRERK